MKIRIKAEGHNIRLWLPTSILKSRVFYRVLTHGVEKITHGVVKNAENTENATQEQTENSSFEVAVQIEKSPQSQSDNLPQSKPNNLPELPTQQETVQFTRKQQLEMYRILKQVIKTRGHFNLVEVESADGQRVLIRV